MTHVMLDLETLGTGPCAAIVAIGAVEFDPQGSDLGETFFRRVDVESAIRYGEVDGSTVKWWLTQSEEARAATFGGDSVSLPSALRSFNAWLLQRSEHQPKGICVWGNGATFDNVVIRSAMRATEIDPVWSFRNDKCYRTVVNLLPEDQRPVMPRTGTYHHAVDDAVWQAKYLQEYWKRLCL